jgi:excisionase family DNA binding protein
MPTAETTKPTDTLLLRVPEAAHLLGLGQTTVHRLIRQGRLSVVKIDRSVRIKRSDLEQFVQRQGEV